MPYLSVLDSEDGAVCSICIYKGKLANCPQYIYFLDFTIQNFDSITIYNILFQF